MVALSTCLSSPLYSNENVSLSYLDECWVTKNAHFLRGHRESVSKWWNYNNLVRKLYIAQGYRWGWSELRGIFSSIVTTGSRRRAVVLISSGNCSSWGSLGRGRGFVCISWPGLNKVITFYSRGGRAFPITPEHLCISIMKWYKNVHCQVFVSPTEESASSFSLLKRVQRKWCSNDLSRPSSDGLATLKQAGKCTHCGSKISVSSGGNKKVLWTKMRWIQLSKSKQPLLDRLSLPITKFFPAS